MQREAVRTLRSLSAAYQCDVDAADYEVIAIDNNSTFPLDKGAVEKIDTNFRYSVFKTEGVSPVEAVNAGVKMAESENIAVIVDGARMATPGLVSNTLRGLRAFEDPFICALSWHLGPDVQCFSMQSGYNQASEDRLLDIIDWQNNGYKLFDISTIAPSSKPGFFGDVPRECSWFAMRKKTFESAGGFDPLFQTPGGGFVNHDFRNRVMAIQNICPVVMLGEGVFHQFHGGISTNVTAKELEETLEKFRQEYQDIRGIDYVCQNAPSAVYLGGMPVQAHRFVDMDDG
jgi:hypothetical protein